MSQLNRKHKWGIFILITGLIIIVAIILITKRTPIAQKTASNEPSESTTTEITTTEITTTVEIITTEIVTTETETNEIATTEPYVRPFAEYIEQNTDFAGWITVDGTSIDEPFVQSVDNEYYLIHDYTGARNITGAIYMDYKNLGNFYDNHISLYGHYMTDGSIFHDLHYFKDPSFFEKNNTITIHGLRESKEYEIFSVHVVSAYTYYLYLDLEDEALVEYAKHFQRLSMFEKDVTFPKDLKLLTLVTCTYEYDNARILIHAFAK